MDTLTQQEPHLMLAAMFSGRHTVCKDSEKGYVFPDRGGKRFRHILNWLRDGVVPSLSDSECSELLREAKYYQLLGLVDGVNEVLNSRMKDEEMDTELTRTDILVRTYCDFGAFSRILSVVDPDLSVKAFAIKGDIANGKW